MEGTRVVWRALETLLEQRERVVEPSRARAKRRETDDRRATVRIRRRERLEHLFGLGDLLLALRDGRAEKGATVRVHSCHRCLFAFRLFDATATDARCVEVVGTERDSSIDV